MNLYKNLKDQLSSLLTKNSAFNTKINAYTTKVKDFALATTTLETLVANSVNGLEKSTDCTAVANSLRLLYNVFCVNFLESLCSLVIKIRYRCLLYSSSDSDDRGDAHRKCIRDALWEN